MAKEKRSLVKRMFCGTTMSASSIVLIETAGGRVLREAYRVWQVAPLSLDQEMSGPGALALQGIQRVHLAFPLEGLLQRPALP